jgi:hypothetical protein
MTNIKLQGSTKIDKSKWEWVFITWETEVTLMKRLWLGEQESSQKRLRKFLKHAGQPTRMGTACWTCTLNVSNCCSVQQTLPFKEGHRLWILADSRSAGLTEGEG